MPWALASEPGQNETRDRLSVCCNRFPTRLLNSEIHGQALRRGMGGNRGLCVTDVGDVAEDLDVAPAGRGGVGVELGQDDRLRKHAESSVPSGGTRRRAPAATRNAGGGMTGQLTAVGTVTSTKEVPSCSAMMAISWPVSGSVQPQMSLVPSVFMSATETKENMSTLSHGYSPGARAVSQ